MIPHKHKILRCGSSLKAWWPDAAYAAVLAIGAIVLIIQGGAAESLTIGLSTSGLAADLYLAMAAISGAVIVASIIRGDAVSASRGAAVLSALFAVQAVFVIGYRGIPSVFTASVYVTCAFLILDRSLILARFVGQGGINPRSPGGLVP